MDHIDDSAALPRSLPRSGAPNPAPSETTRSSVPSLVFLCRNVIVTYLEQYTPESFAICDVDEWEELLRHRVRMVQPKQRLSAPPRLLKEIVPHHVLAAIESVNAHLAVSSFADAVLWQNCVDHCFPWGGSTRPPELHQPWPVLVERLTTAWEFGRVVPTEEERLQVIYSTSWNVALLRDTGLGKAVKQLVKRRTPHRDELQQVLEAWKRMATEPKAAQAVYVPPTETREKADVAADLQLAERCSTWKALFVVLQERKAQRQAAQGARMRRRRQEAASNRPQLVTVRPVKVITKSTTVGTSDRIIALRQEVRQQASHLSLPKPARTSFGDAVAFCSVSHKGGQKRKGGTIMQPLGNGKHMKIPAARGGGTVATLRAIGSQWKLPPRPHQK